MSIRRSAAIHVVMLLLLTASCRDKGKATTDSQAAVMPTGADSAPLAKTAVVTGEKSSEVTEGITWRQLQVDRDGTPMSAWIYRQAAITKRAPVILIGAAGTPLIWGMTLGEGDQAEHLPWAKRGYVVVAYSLDGPVEDQRDDAAVEAGVRAFLRASAGLDNARAALAIALAKEPLADPDRIYAVGHSSAATLALRVGAELEEVKAIVAFNPVVDVEARTEDAQGWLRQLDSKLLPLLHSSFPLAHLAALRAKPLLLFHAENDSNVPVAESRRLAEALAPMAATSKLLIVPTGDHYDSMIQQGIPAALSWVDERAGIKAPASPPASTAAPR